MISGKEAVDISGVPFPPFFLFEVEDGGTMREALHRLYNAMAFDARFFVICPKENFEKFDMYQIDLIEAVYNFENNDWEY